MDNSEFQQEKETLHNVLEKYEDIMQFYNSRIDAIPKIYKDDTTMIVFRKTKVNEKKY